MTHRCRPPEWIIQIHSVWKELSKSCNIHEGHHSFINLRTEQDLGQDICKLIDCSAESWTALAFSFLMLQERDLSTYVQRLFFFGSLHLSKLAIEPSYSVHQVKSRKHIFKMHQHLRNITCSFTLKRKQRSRGGRGGRGKEQDWNIE